MPATGPDTSPPLLPRKPSAIAVKASRRRSTRAYRTDARKTARRFSAVSRRGCSDEDDDEDADADDGDDDDDDDDDEFCAELALLPLPPSSVILELLTSGTRL